MISDYDFIIFDIATNDGKKFCECKKNGYQVTLSTKQGELDIMSLVEQVANPDVAMKKRKKNIR